MHGLQVVKSLRADPALPYLPVCALTARSDAESRRKAAAAAFDGYIVKPATFPDLLAFLKRYRR
jgi:CheY-like chemotaxis protein